MAEFEAEVSAHVTWPVEAETRDEARAKAREQVGMHTSGPLAERLQVDSVRRLGGDEGASPVVGVVLAVAITVGLGASLVAFTDVFEPAEPVSASARMAGEDLDGNREVDALAVVLESADDSPSLDVATRVQHPGGSFRVDVDGWEPGQAQRFPCVREGPHVVVLSARGQVVADTHLVCGEPLHVPVSAADGDEADEGHGTDRLLFTERCERLHALGAFEETAAERLVDLCLGGALS